MIGAKNFAVGVQWHPEYRFWEKSDYKALLDGFYAAARAYQASRL